MNREPRPPSAATIRPSATVSIAGSGLIPSGARLDATSVPSPNAGAMNPSPHGRFPNAPRAARSPSSEIPGRPSSASLRSVPRGHETCARVPRSSSVGDRLRPRRHRVEVDRHRAREHLLGDAGHRRTARAGVARALAGARVAERPAGRRDEHVARRQRRRDRRRGLGAVGSALIHHDQDRVGAGRARLLPQRLADRPPWRDRPRPRRPRPPAPPGTVAPRSGRRGRDRSSPADHMRAVCWIAPAPRGLHSRARRSSSVG